MNNAKKMVIALAAIGLLILVSKFAVPAQDNTDARQNGAGKAKVIPNIFGFRLPFMSTPQERAWDAFQDYLELNKNRDLEGIRNSVYKLSPVCEDPKLRIDCEARMGAAYMYGKELKQEDFVNFWEDDKQIILATDFKVEEDENVIGRNRAIIYFLKDGGDLKLLSYSPFKGLMVSKGTASQEEIQDRIVRYTADDDEDGIADYEEECLASADGAACNKTNPKLKDSDGDGLWDGIEALMGTK